MTDQRLFRDVYKLVDKVTNEPVSDVFSAMDTPHARDRYAIQPVKAHKSIADHYAQMYKSVDKIDFKPKPSLKGFEDFLIMDSSESSRYHRLSSRQTTTNVGSRNKITFYDMKSPDEVMRKISTRNASRGSNIVKSNNLRKSEWSSQAHEKDMRKVYSQQLAKFELFNNLDEIKFGRDDLKRFFAQFYKHLHLTELTAIEGIHFARGTLMEKSPTFNRDKLLDWLVM